MFAAEAFENPYKHPTRKPHTFDVSSVRARCLEIFEILQTSRHLDTIWANENPNSVEVCGWKFPRQINLHRATAEERLAKGLLYLAVVFRAFDDRQEPKFSEFVGSIENATDGFLIWIGSDVSRGSQTSLREACNKIIHATDIRPRYHGAGSAPRSRIWKMTGGLILSGTQSKSEWTVHVAVPCFIEAMLDICDWLDQQT